MTDDPQESLSRPQFLLANRILDRFDKAWNTENRPSIKDYLEDDELSQEPPSCQCYVFQSLLEIELERRRDLGEQPNREEYSARFPQYEAVVVDVFDSFEQTVDVGPEQAAVENELPEKIGKYTIDKKLGKGGFGTVYRGTVVEADGMHVRAIKVPNSVTADKLIHLKKEAQVWKLLKHQNIVLLYDIQDDKSFGWFLDMELITGKSLKEDLEDKEKLPPEKVLEIILPVAEAIKHAHAKKVTHLDLKPANILLDSGRTPHVTDFGLATHIDNLHWKERELAGTPTYMAPEQWDGDPDEKSDIWAIGVILYELLTGKRPFLGDDREELKINICEKELEPPSELNDRVSKQLDNICSGCLKKLPTDRPTAADLVTMLGNLAPLQQKVFEVPRKKNPFFTERVEIQNKLKEKIESEKRAVLSGLGGCGKTQTALEYAHQYKDKYRYVFWMTADSTMSIQTGYLKLATRLPLPLGKRDKPDDTIAAVKNWLNTNPEWLLIFDKADDLKALSNWLPTEEKGHVIVTTRVQEADWLGVTDPITIKSFSSSEALEFLRHRTNRQELDSDELSAAHELAGELGFLPLALEQAAAYICGKQASFRDYLTSFLTRRLELLNSEQPHAGDYDESVATTWFLNFEEVEKTSLASADLLRLSALLNGEQIPRELIVRGAAQLGPNIEKALDDVENVPTLWNDLLGPLRRYSLIDVADDSEQYSIHLLVQEVLIEKMNKEERSCWAERAVRSINVILPESSELETWDQWERFLPQFDKATQLIDSYEIEYPSVVEDLLLLGNYFAHRDLSRESELVFRKATDIEQVRSGGESATLSVCYCSLARCLLGEARLDDASKLAEQALDMARRNPTNHRQVVFCLQISGAIAREKMRFEEAEKLHREALALVEKSLGADDGVLHATVLNNLAEDFRSQERLDKSLPIQMKVLKIAEEALGTSHPRLVPFLNNLAFDQSDQGSKEKFFLRALSIAQEVHGRRHPDSANVLLNLCTLYIEQERYNDAESALSEAVAIVESIYDPNGIKMLHVLHCRGNLMFQQGKFKEAENLARRQLRILEKHPDTLPGKTADIYVSISLLCLETERPREANEAIKNAFEIKERMGLLGIPGEDIDNLFSIVKGLEEQTGNVDQSRKYYERAMAILEAESQSNEGGIATCLNYLARIASREERYSEAKSMFLRALEIRQRIFGLEHDCVGDCFVNLGGLYRHQNDDKQAILSFEHALSIKRLTQGEEHWQVKLLEKLLAETRQHNAPPENQKPLDRRRGVGRNDPCPCKSGKKYKNCCKNKPR